MSSLLVLTGQRRRQSAVYYIRRRRLPRTAALTPPSIRAAIGSMFFFFFFFFAAVLFLVESGFVAAAMAPPSSTGSGASSNASGLGGCGDATATTTTTTTTTAVFGVGVLGTSLCRQLLLRSSSTANAKITGITKSDQRHEAIRNQVLADADDHHDNGIEQSLDDERFELLTASDGGGDRRRKCYRNVVFCAPPSGFDDYAGAVRDAAAELWQGPDAGGTFVFTSSGAVYVVVAIVSSIDRSIEAFFVYFCQDFDRLTVFFFSYMFFSFQRSSFCVGTDRGTGKAS